MIEVEDGGGDGCCWTVDPPRLVLYGDGLFIRSKQSDGRDEMMARKLNRSEMCALFNAYKLLDQYDPGGLEKLSPRQMVLWAWPEEWGDEPEPWPVKGIS